MKIPIKIFPRVAMPKEPKNDYFVLDKTRKEYRSPYTCIEINKIMFQIMNKNKISELSRKKG
jgi:hypothetical protein